MVHVQSCCFANQTYCFLTFSLPFASLNLKVPSHPLRRHWERYDPLLVLFEDHRHVSPLSIYSGSLLCVLRDLTTLLILSYYSHCIHNYHYHHGIWAISFGFRRALRLQGRYDALRSLCLNSRVLPRSLSFCPRSGEGSFCRPTLLPWCRSTRLR